MPYLQENLRRSSAAIENFSLDVLLAERARELYYEGWRRTDLIRFGKFLDAWSEKEASNPRYLWYPFPSGQIVANPDLKQNADY